MERDSSRRAPRSSAGTLRITERDQMLLRFAAEHRFVTVAQVALLLRVSRRTAEARLSRLRGGGYLHRERRLDGEPAWHRISREGLRAIAGDLPAPRPADLATHRHDRGLAWLMLAARGGCFGPVHDVIGERRMRSEDGRAGDRDVRHGVRLGGTGAGGRDRLHYPDMVLVTGDRRRAAFELELTSKSREHRERILAAYAADRSIHAVVYLVESPAAGRAVQRSAARLGISGMVHVQRVRLEASAPSESRGRAATRRHGRAQARTAGSAR